MPPLFWAVCLDGWCWLLGGCLLLLALLVLLLQCNELRRQSLDLRPACRFNSKVRNQACPAAVCLMSSDVQHPLRCPRLNMSCEPMLNRRAWCWLVTLERCTYGSHASTLHVHSGN